MPPPAASIPITNPPLWITSGGLGFTRTVTVAEFNSGIFGNAPNEVWFEYTTGSDPEAFGWFIGLATGFSPATNLYESDGTTLITGNTGDNAMWYPLANNTTYYVRIRRQGGGAIAFDFNCLFEGAPTTLTTVPDGSWVVNDDSTYDGADGFPTVVYGPNGEFLGFTDGPPAGETGDSLPDGTSLWHDRFGMYGGQFALFDSNFGFIDDITPTPACTGGFPCVTNDGNFFYFIDRGTGNVWQVDPSDGALTLVETIVFAGDFQAFGVSRDGQRFYWANGYEDGKIYYKDIGGSNTEFYTIPGFDDNVDYIALTAFDNWPGKILVLIDGTIATWWFDQSAFTFHVLHFDDTGTVLHDYDYTDLEGYVNHIHYSTLGASAINIWFFNPFPDQNDGGFFAELVWSTGILSTIFSTAQFSSGENMIPGNATIFGPSISCISTTHVYPGSPPEPGTWIEIIKQVVSDDSGDNDIEFQVTFTDADGVEHVFNLTNSDSELFENLAPGTYSVVELQQAGFIIEYTVSNGDPNTAIVISENDQVTVAIVNTRIIHHGIYKIQPNKRNDTLWTDIATGATIDVKIPNPRIRTALVGE